MFAPIHPPGPRQRALLLAVLLSVLLPRAAQGEGKIGYKYQDYRESAGRVGVQAHYGLVELGLGAEATVRLTGVIDAIAGATPTGAEPAVPGGAVPLALMSDRREAWTIDLARTFGRMHWTAGYANSRESDYVSNAGSLTARADFRQRTTSVTAGASVTVDRVLVFHQADRARKEGFDALLGVNHVVDPLTTVTANAGYGRVTGYLSDPYKIISKRTELLPGLFLPLTFPENRPPERTKRLLHLALNRAFPAWNGALEAGYRHYRDNFGIRSHTWSASWFQKLSPKVMLVPSFRLYAQTAADFYRDYRLSRFHSRTAGVKLVWTPHERLRLDLAYDRYSMRGRDGRTSPSAYPQADITTLGATYTW
jgi:hypothetical protein